MCIDDTVADVVSRADRGQLGSPLSRRLFLAGTAALGLAACGRNSSTTDTPPAAHSAGFPVTLQGKEGTATIPAEPQRVVTVGFQRDTDTALALGVTPIAMVENTLFPSLIAPWADAELRDPKPELLSTGNGLPFEKIAGLSPDLILATDSYELTDNYARLAEIAPTLSYVDSVDSDTWQQRTTHIGKALGREDQAQKIIANTEAKIRQAAQDHPDFAGKTFSVSAVGGGQLETVLKGDAAITFLEQLGLRISPEVAALQQFRPRWVLLRGCPRAGSRGAEHRAGGLRPVRDEPPGNVAGQAAYRHRPRRRGRAVGPPHR
ncbi:MAG: ABC transporter substrate-binding protein [Pseudonocardiaceae bacterium]